MTFKNKIFVNIIFPPARNNTSVLQNLHTKVCAFLCFLNVKDNKFNKRKEDTKRKTLRDVDIELGKIFLRSQNNDSMSSEIN